MHFLAVTGNGAMSGQEACFFFVCNPSGFLRPASNGLW